MAEYIERKDAVELSNDIIRMIEDLRVCRAIDYNAYSELFDMLCGFDTIPAADVAPVRHGRWINEERVGFGSVESTCSNCERRMIRMPYCNFCPNCGAKMEVQNGG